MSRYARRVDGNHGEIVAALRKVGARVFSIATVGKGCPDLLVGWRAEFHLLEVKDGSLPPSARKLTPDEKTFHAAFASPRLHVVHSVAEALVAIGVKT